MDFSSFLADLIKSENITNVRLSEKLEVPAATISHLLSGRNKPSIDFIQKLIKNFPKLDLYKILGLEKYNNFNNSEINTTSPPTTNQQDLFIKSNNKNKTVKKVVMLYDDNSFEEYNL